MPVLDAKDRDPESYAIIGAAMAVHRELGHGFLELVYQEAFAIELTLCAIPHERETKLPILYRGKILATQYKTDFICFGKVIVEIKALTRLSPVERAQTLNYLKAGHLERAILLNFGATSLEYQRFILST